jgi:hypothetical protein
MIQIVNNTKQDKSLVCFMCRAVLDELSVSTPEVKEAILKQTNRTFE